MRKILIFGNSGSGKSTLSRRLSAAEGLAHLDLDELAWLDTTPPQRAPIEQSLSQIQQFTGQHEAWIIEGCYTDLLQLLDTAANEVIFLNLPIDLCCENARGRPWEPHKYPSKEAQDENLNMLLDWIVEYKERDDVFSLASHLAFYDSFAGKKTMLTVNKTAMS